MRVVIVGAEGMVGGYVGQLLDPHHAVYPCSRAQCDITSSAHVEEVFDRYMPDIVINCSAYNAVDACEKDVVGAYLINATGPAILARHCRNIGAGLIHLSTDYVFDGHSYGGYKEDAAAHPVSVYGASKLQGEREIMESGLAKFAILRASRLFGRQGGSLTAKKSFVDVMIEKMKNGEPVVYAIDDEVSAPTYAVDLARMVAHFIQLKWKPGLYHAVNDGSATWYDVVTVLGGVLGYRGRIEAVDGSYFSRPARRPAHSLLINTKLPRQRSWRVALEEYCYT